MQWNKPERNEGGGSIQQSNSGYSVTFSPAAGGHVFAASKGNYCFARVWTADSDPKDYLKQVAELMRQLCAAHGGRS